MSTLGDADTSEAADYQDDGTKQVETFLQENALLKAENKRLREELEAMQQQQQQQRSRNQRLIGDLNGRISEDESDGLPRRSTEASDRHEINPDRHELTLDANPIQSQGVHAGMWNKRLVIIHIGAIWSYSVSQNKGSPH